MLKYYQLKLTPVRWRLAQIFAQANAGEGEARSKFTVSRCDPDWYSDELKKKTRHPDL